MKSMDQWCTEHHGASGLTDAVAKSKITTLDAEKQVLAFIQQHVPAGQGILAGNSIHVDRQFIQQDMPRLAEYLHYRLVDVSTIKELAKRWYPSIIPPAKKTSHRAMEDILESIQELKFYRQHLFK